MSSMLMTYCIGKSLREVAGWGDDKAWLDVDESGSLWTDLILQEASVSGVLANIAIVYLVGMNKVEMFGPSTPAPKLSITACWT